MSVRGPRERLGRHPRSRRRWARPSPPGRGGTARALVPRLAPSASSKRPMAEPRAPRRHCGHGHPLAARQSFRVPRPRGSGFAGGPPAAAHPGPARPGIDASRPAHQPRHPAHPVGSAARAASAVTRPPRRHVSGLTERTALVHEGLRALTQRESARRLARLGGSEPALKAVRRRRARAIGVILADTSV